jgi:hypothetical protein
MPAIRPADISNRIRLTNEVGTPDRSFVPKCGAVDALLPLSGALVSAVIHEPSPDEETIPGFGAEDEFFSGANELRDPTLPASLKTWVVPLRQFEAVFVAIACQPPVRSD